MIVEQLDGRLVRGSNLDDLNRPVEVENTPNYAGAGFGLGLGYSARQIFDFGAFAQYLPGKYNTNAQSDEATLIIYGGEVAFRITSSVVIGSLPSRLNSYCLRKEESVGCFLISEMFGMLLSITV